MKVTNVRMIKVKANSKSQSNQAYLEENIKKVNFDLLVNDICDINIVYEKMTTVFSSIKSYLRAVSCMYNDMIICDKALAQELQPLRVYTTYLKERYEVFRAPVEELRSSTFIPGSINYKMLCNRLEVTFKLMCKSECIETLAHAYKELLNRDVDDPDWIVKSKVSIEPFKGYAINAHALYNMNKTAALKYFKLMKQSVVEFYKTYVRPNFSLDKAIEMICEYLDALYKKERIRCNLIPGYLRRIHKSGLFDIESMNLAYIETDNKNVFVSNLVTMLLSNDSADLKPSKEIYRQINVLLNYLKSQNTHKEIESTLNVGVSMFNKEYEDGEFAEAQGEEEIQ